MTKNPPERAFYGRFDKYKREIVIGVKICLIVGFIFGIFLVIQPLFAQQNNFNIEPNTCTRPDGLYTINFDLSFNGEIDTPYQCSVKIESIDVKERINDCSIVFAYRNHSNNITGWDETYRRNLEDWEMGQLNRDGIINYLSVEIGPFPKTNYEGYSGELRLYCNNGTLYGEHFKKYYIKERKEVLEEISEEVNLQPNWIRDYGPTTATILILILYIAYDLTMSRKKD